MLCVPTTWSNVHRTHVCACSHCVTPMNATHHGLNVFGGSCSCIVCVKLFLIVTLCTLEYHYSAGHLPRIRDDK